MVILNIKKSLIYLFIIYIWIILFPVNAKGQDKLYEQPLTKPPLSLSDVENKDLVVRENSTLYKEKEGLEKKHIDKTKGLYLLVGHYTYFPELNSEKPVYIINEIGKGTVPDWRDIMTFKDMREIGLFGDIWAGVGLHCGRYLSLWSVAGGIMWKINNENRLGPLKLQLDLTGFEAFIEAGIDYYPFGKTKLSLNKNEPFFSRLKQTLMGTKPYFSLSISYSHFEASGDARIDFFNFPIKYTREKEIDIISMSPFIFMDFPITPRTDIFVGLGYFFGFDAKSFKREHKNEIEGPVMSTGVKIDF